MNDFQVKERTFDAAPLSEDVLDYAERLKEVFLRKVHETRESLAQELKERGLTNADVYICDNLQEVINSAAIEEENGKLYLKHYTEYRCWVEKKV